MRMSQLFGRTLRQPPADARLTSHQLALRAALVRFLGPGVYGYLPLGWRVARKIEAILREEMDALGAQEMLMPAMHAAGLWQATGQQRSVGSAPAQAQNRTGHNRGLATTQEEVVAQLAHREVRSYRDLPRFVYQIQTEVQEEPRPPRGLLRARAERAREFRMKSAHSLNADAAGLDAVYAQILETYRRIFTRCDLNPLRVDANTGKMGGAASHHFMLPHANGEELIIHCTSCAYAANAEWADFKLRPAEPQLREEAHSIATPDCETIADVAAFAGVPTSQTLKAVFYARDDGELVLVVIRGDLEVNETKLRSVLSSRNLQPATAEAVRAVGAEPGYGSPLGLQVRQTLDGPGVLVVADRSIEAGSNFVAGANRAAHHLVGVNYPRDFAITILADITQAQAGHLCAQCGATLAAEPAIELGRCLKLGTHYAESLGATYVNGEGHERPIKMGSYRIGVGRLMAAVIETHYDEHGIVWPPALAPFQIHLLTLGTNEAVRAQGEAAYAQMQDARFQVLYDDRNESAGVKFADTDLIGCPVRATVSRRSLKAGGVELKARWAKNQQVVTFDGLAEEARRILDGFQPSAAPSTSSMMRS